MKRPFVLGGTNRGRGHKRLTCPKCSKKGLGAMKASPNGPFYECCYCSGVTHAGADGRPARPYGWHCELVHTASGEVVQSQFFTDAPLEGPAKVKGFVWRATPLVRALSTPQPADAAGAGPTT